MRVIRIIMLAVSIFFAILLVFSTYSACWTSGSTATSYASQAAMSALFSIEDYTYDLEEKSWYVMGKRWEFWAK